MLFCALFVCGLVTQAATLPLRHLKAGSEEPVPFNWFRQPLDHFNPQDTNTWLQKYLVNKQYWGGQGYPIFLLLGGEGPMGNNSVTGHFVLNHYASQFKALVVSVEHRFYGESLPLQDLSTANLVYLTSQQALADYATFTKFLKSQNPGSKVVSFGGSYSGALSAWLRYKYPDLIDIAIASSGPIVAQTVVANSLDTTNLPCNEAIHDATIYYMHLLKTEAGKRKIEKDFVTCSPIKSQLDAITFLEFLTDTVAGFVQYNDDNNNFYPFNMNKMCQILTEGKIDVTFPAFIASWNNFTQSNCSDVSYADTISQLKNVDPKASTAAGRSWTWQTCNEFGFYQTGESSKQPFSKDITLSYFIGMCKEVFGKGENEVEIAVEKTNKFYGGRSIREKTSKTFFLNGSVDPWHALGETTPSHSLSVPVVFIKGTAHCADLYPPRDSDLPELTQARAKVVSFLKHWLQN